MTKAYSYLRFSDPSQSLGDSTRRQTEQAVKYCAQHNLILDDSLSLQDRGISAFKGKNRTSGALGRFLVAVEQGQVQKGSQLLLESVDRLSREEPWEAQKTFQAIINSGITVVTLIDGQKYTRETIRQNPSQLFVLLATMIRAHEESATKSMRVSASYQARREALLRGEKPLMGRGPRFMRMVAGKWQLDAEKSKAVRLMIKLALQGQGSNTIANTLNKQGVEAWGCWKKTKQPSWNAPTVLHILRSPVLYGCYVPTEAKSGETASAGDLQVEYRIWCRENNTPIYQMLTAPKFKAEMTSRGYQSKKTAKGIVYLDLRIVEEDRDISGSANWID